MRNYKDTDYDTFASKALVFSKEKKDATVTKMSASLTKVQQSFSNLLAYTSNVIKLTPSLIKKDGVSNSIVQSTSPINTDSLVGQVALVNSQVQKLSEKLKNLDLSQSDDNDDFDLDLFKTKGKKIKGGIPKAGKLLGAGLAAGSIAYDIYDRVSEKQSAGNIAAGVGGGLLGGALGARGGAVLAQGFGIPAPIGGLVGGAIGYAGGSMVGDKAYQAFIKKSEKQVLAATEAQLRSDGIVGPTEPSSKFAEYMRDSAETASKITAMSAGLGAGGVGYYAISEFGQGFSEGYAGTQSMSSNDAVSKAMSYFQSQGWTKEQAAGIVGNLQVESGNFDPDVVYGKRRGDGGKAVGIAQWHPDRQSRFYNVMRKPLPGSSLMDQLKFVQWELNNTERGAGNALRNARTAEEAATIVDRLYERSSGAALKQRIVNARNLIQGESIPSSMGSVVGQFFAMGREAVGGGKFIHPVNPARLGSPFGPRGRGMHKGQDYPVPMGTPVMAAQAGTVTFTGFDPNGYGAWIQVRHADGTETRYGHLSKIGVKTGQTVTKGQVIGLVGSTGHSTGPHLHFEIRKNGVAVDPISLIGGGTKVPTNAADQGTEPQHTSPTARNKVLTTGEFLKKAEISKREGKGNILIVNKGGSAQQRGGVSISTRSTPPLVSKASPAEQYRRHFGS